MCDGYPNDIGKCPFIHESLPLRDLRSLKVDNYAGVAFLSLLRTASASIVFLMCMETNMCPSRDSQLLSLAFP